MPEIIDSSRTLISFQEANKLYEDGKHRRYELLFAVNGGAFAIAKLIGEKKLQVGNLSLPQLAAGMILFTIVMVFDIYMFGDKWHRLSKEIETHQGNELFGWPGRVVLILIGLLLCAGWTLASGWL
jgi:hypothetical protein